LCGAFATNHASHVQGSQSPNVGQRCLSPRKRVNEDGLCVSLLPQIRVGLGADESRAKSDGHMEHGVDTDAPIKRALPGARC
jgi:hypothetical protein